MDGGTWQGKKATLYRMVMREHVCPFGVKSLDLLKRQGYAVEDRHLTSRAETEAFMALHGVETTPQTFIEGERVGGYDDLRRRFGKSVPDPEAVSYRPVIAVFVMSLALALAASWGAFGSLWSGETPRWAVGIALSMLAVLKLQDLEGFTNRFLGYDLLAQRVPRYAYVYPFAEGLLGVLTVASALPWLAAALALAVGGVGAVSVVKAVYIDGRELKCACVGGASKVPLGAVSLAEDLMMVGMGAWMLLGQAG